MVPYLALAAQAAAFALWVWASVDSIRARRSYWWMAVACSGPFALYLGPLAYLSNFVLLPLAGVRPLDQQFSERRRLQRLEASVAERHLPAEVLELAEAYLRQGRHADALRLLRAMLDERPEDIAGHVLAGRALVAIGRPKDAERHLRYAAEEDPESGAGEAPLRLAAAIGASGRAEEAEAMLLRVFERHRRPEAAVLAARSLASRGKREEARDLLHEMLERCAGQRWLDPQRDVPWLAEARRDLKELE